MPSLTRSVRPTLAGMIAPGAFVAVAVAYLLLVFTRPQNYLLTGLDYVSHQFFLKTFLGESLRAGEWPLWNPYICAGRPFAADPQSGVFYPPNWLYAVMSVEAATTLLITVHIAAAGFFAYVLGRTLRMSHLSAGIAGVAFMLNAFIVTHAYRGQSERIEAIAYMPLILALAERAARARRVSAYLWLGVVGAVQFVAGAPQVTWMTWVSVGLYLLVRQFMAWRRDGAGGLGRVIGGGMLAIVVVAMLSAVQLFPTYELVVNSNRSAPTIEFASAFAFEIEDVVHLVFPCFEAPPAYAVSNPEVIGYVGMLTLVLGAVGVLRSGERIRWAIIAVALLHTFIMIGRATPVFDLLYYALPGMRSFRLPSRSIVMVALCVAMLAGFGADALTRGDGRRRSSLVAVAVAMSLTAFMWMTSARLTGFPGLDGKRGPTLLIPLAFAAASVVLVAPALLRRRAWVRAVWLIAIAADLFYVGGTFSRYREEEAKLYEPPQLEETIVTALREIPETYRFALPSGLVRENAGVLIGQSGVNGFISLSLDRYYRFVHEIAWQPVPEKFTHRPDELVFQPDNPFPFRVLNVRYGMALDPVTKEPRVLPHNEEVPRAFFVARHEVIEDDAATIERMRSPAWDPLETVILAEPPPSEFGSGAAGTDATGARAGDTHSGVVEITSYEPMRIVLRADAPTDGFLVLSELDYPGWRATVDGEAVPILRADYLLRAIPLRAGVHEEIEFQYAPASFTLGWIVTLLSGAAVAVGLIVLRRRERRAEDAASARIEGAAEPARVHPERPWFAWAQAAVVLALCPLALPIVQRANAEQYTNVGGKLAERGYGELAIEWLTVAGELAPNSGAVWRNLGAVYGRMGRIDDAIRHIERSLELDPDAVHAMSNLATLKEERGETDAAIALLQVAISKDPEHAASHFNLGRLLVRLSRPVEAEPHLMRSIELVPGKSRSYQQVARVWTEARAYESSIAVLRLGLSRLPRSADIADDLASLLAACPEIHLRNGPEAVRLSEFANAVTGSRDPYKLRTLAAAYAQVGEDAKAVEVAQAALQRARAVGATGLAEEITASLRSMGIRPAP